MVDAKKQNNSLTSTFGAADAMDSAVPHLALFSAAKDAPIADLDSAFHNTEAAAKKFGGVLGNLQARTEQQLQQQGEQAEQAAGQTSSDAGPAGV